MLEQQVSVPVFIKPFFRVILHQILYKEDIVILDMYRHYKSHIIAILIIILLLPLFLMHPISSMAQKPVPLTPPLELIECDTKFQPTDQIDMNTVIVGSKIKTIHVEKEVVDCIDLSLIEQGVGRTIIADVSIYTKIIEDISNNKTILSPKVDFEVVTCYKDDNGLVLGCETYIPSTTLPPIKFSKTCLEPVTVPFPIEMDTVVNSSHFIKSVEAQKEVFACGDVIDVTIFTEIFEDLVQDTSNKIYFSTTCYKQIEVPKVLGCKASSIKQL